MNEKIEKIEIDCFNCETKFKTYIEIKTGDIDNIFCSDECAEEFYKKDKD